MNHKEYILHLIGEISNYLLERSPSRLVLSLHQEEDGLHLCALDSTNRSEEELDEMRRILNAGARPELSEYYGHLAGSDLVGGARLDLIGWQVKAAEVSRSDSGTKIDLWLGSPAFEEKRFSFKRR